MDHSRRKRLYWTTLGIAFVVLQLSFVAVLAIMERARVAGPPMSMTGVLVMPFFFISAVVAEVACKRAGLSAGGQRNEELLGPITDPGLPPIEVRINRDTHKGMAVLCGGFTVFVLLALRFARSVPGTEIYGYYTAAFSGVAAVVYGIAYLCRWGFIARLDAAGLYVTEGVGRKRIPWEQVRSCKLSTLRNVFGNQACTRAEFRDPSGDKLAEVSMVMAPHDECEEFLGQLRARFGAPFNPPDV